MDIIGCLPPEISQEILLYLDFFERNCVTNTITKKRKHVVRIYIYKESMLKQSFHWQAIYTYNRLIQSNWMRDNYKSISIRGNRKYDRILYFDDDILITRLFSMYNIYDIINLSTGNIYFNFQENDAVTKIIKHQNLLIYFMNKTLKILNLETKSLVLNLKLQIFTVRYLDKIQMEVYNNLLAVFNSPRFFCVINLETKKFNVEVLGCVLDGCFGDNIIITALYDQLIVHDLNDKRRFVIIISQIRGEKFQTVSLCTINQETKSLHEIRSIQVEPYRQMTSFPNKDTMFFWNCEGRKGITYKIWRFATKNRFVAFEFNEKELVSIRANNRHMFLYTKDKILHMWCLETNKFIRNISRSDMGLYFKNFQVTEKKSAYIGSDICLRILNYDFIPE